MDGVAEFARGSYRFLPAVFQYSAGVAALPGYQIRRVRFANLVTLADGFLRAQQIMRDAGRPLTAFCACELRSPAPFTDDGFRTFNEVYVAKLRQWGLFEGDANPVARSNVCPQLNPPEEPSFHAFSFTVKAVDARPTFVIAGSAEATEGPGSYAERTIRRGETGADAIREKASFVLGEMERRLNRLGFAWADTTAVQVYTVHDIHPFLANEIGQRGAARNGLTWHLARPPVRGLEYEMDCASIGSSIVI